MSKNPGIGRLSGNPKTDSFALPSIPATASLVAPMLLSTGGKPAAGWHVELTDPVIWGTITINGVALNFPTAGGDVGDVLTITGPATTGWTPAVHTLSFGSTGLTPATVSSNNIVVGGTLNVGHGGTGLTALGPAGTTLTSDGTVLFYDYPARADNLSGGNPNEIPYQVSTNTTGFIPAGVTNQVLIATTGGAPSWGVGTITLGTTSINLGSIATSISGLSYLRLTQDPPTALDAATKQYVDARTGALRNLGAAQAATTGNVGLSGLAPIDGYTPVAGDRILVRAQTNAAQEGVYVASAGAWSYAADADTWAEYVGALVFVLNGTTYAGSSWTQTIGAGGTLGVTAMSWAQIGSALQYNGGPGISIVGATISNTGVLSFSGGVTGLTPSVASNGVVTLGGTLQPGFGGTGVTALGTGVQTAIVNNVNASGGFVTFSGNLGTPTAAVLSNASGLPLTTGVTGVLPIANGGTGQTTANAALNALLPSQTGNTNKFLTTDGANTSWVLNSSGTVSSVDVSGGLTGLVATGGPIISSGTITLSGIVNIASGGTGATTAAGAANAILPSQSGNVGKFLTTDGSNVSWAVNPLGTVTSVDVFGGTTGLTFSGGPVTTSGTITAAGTLNIANGGTGLSSVGGIGTVLTSNGATASWQAIPSSMVYPANGIAVSTGAAWGSSIVPGVGVATALTANIGTAGSFVVNGGVLGTPTSGNFTTGVFSWPTFNQNTTGTANNVTGVVAIANGGSGQTTAQLAMNTFAGSVSSGQYLRGNGTNVVMSAIQAADVPTLNQNTTGTAANVTGVVAVANGGTNITSYTAGDILYATGATTLTKLPIGLSSQVLGSNGSAPTWVASNYLIGYTNSASPFNTAIGANAGDSVTSCTDSVFIGYNAGTNVTTAVNVVAIGSGALDGATGPTNAIAIGKDALGSATTGAINNIAIGASCMSAGASGSNNVAIGVGAGQPITSGTQNVMIGGASGGAMTTGIDNVAVGYQSLDACNTGSQNVALGKGALGGVTTGASNVGVGYNSLILVTTASNNVAVGTSAGTNVTSGTFNTLVGNSAGLSISTGSNNAIFGYTAGDALTTAGNTSAFGSGALGAATGAGNAAFGYNAGSSITTGTNNTIVGSYVGTSSLTGACVISDGAGNIRLYTNNSGALSVDGTNFGTSGQVLVSNGSGAVPTWQNVAAIYTGWWAGIYDTTASQTAALINTAYAVALGSIDPDSSGVSLSAGTRIVVANAGVYTFAPSLQIRNSDTNIHELNLWFRKNGSDLANSNSQFSITSSHGGTDGFAVPSVVFTTKLAANDYIELMWSVSNTAVSIYTVPATAPAPAAPGVIVSVTAV